MNPPLIVDYDIGCQPSPSGSDEMVFQSSSLAFLVFDAVTSDVDPRTGYLEQLGRAIVECEDVVATKLSYPNDEGMQEHPLWAFGLSKAGSVVVVKNSSWVCELESQKLASRRRIWGENPVATWDDFNFRHFLVALKDNTFECVAKDLKVIGYVKEFDDGISVVKKRFFSR